MYTIIKVQKKQIKKIASKMMESNMDLDTISNLTGFAKEEIAKLK